MEEFKGYLEEVLVNMADELMLTGEDKNVLGACKYVSTTPSKCSLSLPFSHSS